MKMKVKVMKGNLKCSCNHCKKLLFKKIHFNAFTWKREVSLQLQHEAVP